MLIFSDHSNKCCDFTFYLIRASAVVHLQCSAFGWQHLFVYPSHAVFYHSHFLSATPHSATYCQAWHQRSVSFQELQEWMDHLNLLFPWRKAVLSLLTLSWERVELFCEAVFLNCGILYWFFKANTCNCHLVAEHRLTFSYLPVFAFN